MSEKALITGVTGFIGSNIAESLECEIYGLVAGETSREDDAGYTSLTGDIRDYETLKRIVTEVKPELVLHLAARTSISDSFDNPLEFFDVNARGAINIAEANIQHNENLEKFILAGTAEEYGVQDTFPIPENAKLQPQNPYAASKAAATKYLQYLRTTRDFPVVICRHGNCFGRTENDNFVVESLLKQMEKSVVKLGDPEPVREFLYIDDVVSAYKQVIERGEPGQTYHFSNEAVSIRELAGIAADITDFSGTIHWNCLPERPEVIPRLELEDTTSRKALNWRPQYDIASGMKRLLEVWAQ